MLHLLPAIYNNRAPAATATARNAAIGLVYPATACPAPSAALGEVDAEALEPVGSSLLLLLVLASSVAAVADDVTEPPATPLGPTEKVIPDIEPAALLWCQ